MTETFSGSAVTQGGSTSLYSWQILSSTTLSEHQSELRVLANNASVLAHQLQQIYHVNAKIIIVGKV